MTTPPETARALASSLMVDRAIADSDTTDRGAAGGQNYVPFHSDDDPLNRRGRRHSNGEASRAARRRFRATHRRAVLAR